jgi:hypothetical protein
MNAYGRTAMTYWQTYLPTQVAQMQDPEAFFEDLGQKVMTLVVTGQDEAVTSQTPPGMSRPAFIQGARRSAEEEALKDLVYLQPEPGTQERRLEGLVLPGWQEQEAPDEAPVPADPAGPPAASVQEENSR